MPLTRATAAAGTRSGAPRPSRVTESGPHMVDGEGLRPPEHARMRARAPVPRHAVDLPSPGAAPPTATGGAGEGIPRAPKTIWIHRVFGDGSQNPYDLIQKIAIMASKPNVFIAKT